MAIGTVESQCLLLEIAKIQYLPKATLWASGPKNPRRALRVIRCSSKKLIADQYRAKVMNSLNLHEFTWIYRMFISWWVPLLQRAMRRWLRWPRCWALRLSLRQVKKVPGHGPGHHALLEISAVETSRNISKLWVNHGKNWENLQVSSNFQHQLVHLV